MLIIHGITIHKKLEKWTELQSKTDVFRTWAKYTKIKFFLMKKPILTPYKPSRTLRSEAIDQSIPRNEKSIPFGIVFKAENSEKLQEKQSEN